MFTEIFQYEHNKWNNPETFDFPNSDITGTVWTHFKLYGRDFSNVWLKHSHE